MISTDSLERRIRRGVQYADKVAIDGARAVWAEVRQSVGLAPTTPDLFGDGQISKTNKNKVRTLTLSLSQARTSGIVNLCPWSVPDCVKVCVAQNGNGAYDSVKLGRLARTRLLVDYPAVFVRLLQHELQRAVKRAERDGTDVAVRMNTYSDIPWSTWAPELFAMFPSVQFYDYTKNPGARPLPNYHLTFSATARVDDRDVMALLGAGQNVAMVTPVRKGQPVPTRWHGRTVADGDLTDYRPDDGAGVIVHLTSKGRAQRLTPGKFVRPLDGFTMGDD